MGQRPVWRSPGALHLRLVGSCLVIALLAACGLPKQTRSLFGGFLRLEVAVDRYMNQNSPVAVDLLVVYKKATLDEILALTAAQWFETREQFMRDHPEQIDQFSWEWVPGQDVPPHDLPFRLGAKGGVIFADYFPPGDFRASINPFEHARLDLQADNFKVEPIDDKPRREAKPKEGSK